jgi:hypothetical protein
MDGSECGKAEYEVKFLKNKSTPTRYWLQSGISLPNS